MSKAFIVYPQGDFDGAAFVVDAESPEEAAELGWSDRDWSMHCTICVLPFEPDKELQFRLTVVSGG